MHPAKNIIEFIAEFDRLVSIGGDYEGYAELCSNYQENVLRDQIEQDRIDLELQRRIQDLEPGMRVKRGGYYIYKGRLYEARDNFIAGHFTMPPDGPKTHEKS